MNWSSRLAWTFIFVVGLASVLCVVLAIAKTAMGLMQ